MGGPPSRSRWPKVEISNSTPAITSGRHQSPAVAGVSGAIGVKSAEVCTSLGNPAPVKAAARAGTVACTSVPGSKSTTAKPVAKFTLASATVGWRFRRFSTAATQPPHFMPETVSTAVGLGDGEGLVRVIGFTGDRGDQGKRWNLESESKSWLTAIGEPIDADRL